VLQDVEVLAVAQQLEGQAPPSNSMVMPGTAPTNPNSVPNATANPAPQPAAKTATLAVTPDDALKIVLAEQKGHIVLALRRSKDTDRPVIADVPMQALLVAAR
jgi:Flp pilus assembly protein CpaB